MFFQVENNLKKKKKEKEKQHSLTGENAYLLYRLSFIPLYAKFIVIGFRSHLVADMKNYFHSSHTRICLSKAPNFFFFFFARPHAYFLLQVTQNNNGMATRGVISRLVLIPLYATQRAP